MEEKAESKLAIHQVHQVLIKNGFYRLPMQSLSEILKLLDMPESLQPKTIQDNAINGIIKIIQKYNNKFNEHLNQQTYNLITRETKDFVTLIFQDIVSSISKKNNSNVSQIPPLISQQNPQNNMLSMYNPMNPMNYMRPPAIPPVMPPTQLPTQNGGDASQSNRYIQQAIRMQQIYMYYYGMYGGFNPMMNPQYPGMNNFMNPYANFSQPPNASKNPSQPGAPNMPMLHINSMGSVNPLSMGINPMGGMPGYPPMGGMMGMPPVLGANTPKNNSVPASNPNTKVNKLQEQMNNFINQGQKNTNTQPNKQPQAIRSNQSKSKLPQEKKVEKNQPDLSKITSQNSIPQLKKVQKKRLGQNSAQKQKTTIQNPPFIVGEISPSTTKRIVRQVSKQINIQADQMFKNCACKGYQRFEDRFLCSICNRNFHFLCLNEPVRSPQTKAAIQCYHCRMRFIDPLNKVKEVIAENYIPNISENKFWLQCNLKPYQYLCKQKGKAQVRNEIQMRCLKVSHTQNSQITWPDQCIIKLNGQRIIQIPALQMNSSLKKRKDYSIIITSNIYNKIPQNETQSLEKVKLSLEIKSLSKEEASHKKIKNNYTFAFAIYFIERLTVDQLYQRIVAQQKVPEVPDYMNKLMKTGQKEVQIDKISISLRDPFTWDLIKAPVRGNKCLHGQCFDLRTFISFMSTARNRTWKCPVCNKDARKFTIDSEQLALIKKVEQSSSIPSEITFMRTGQIFVKADNPSEEQQSVVNSEKRKKIHKSPKLERNSRPERENNESKQSRNHRQSKQQKEAQMIDQKKASREVGKEIVLDIDESQN